MPGVSRTIKEPVLYPERSLDYLALGALLLAGRQLLNREVWDAGRELETSRSADGVQRVVGDHANIACFGHRSDLLGMGQPAGHVGAYVPDGTPFQQHLELVDGVEPFNRCNGDRDVTCQQGRGLEIVRQDRAIVEGGVIRLYRPAARAQNPSRTGRTGTWPFRGLRRSAGPRGGGVPPGA